MHLTRLRGGAGAAGAGGGCPDGKTCPTVFLTDRGTLAVVGSTITDPEVLAALGLPAHESVVEIPRSLLPEVTADAERG